MMNRKNDKRLLNQIKLEMMMIDENQASDMARDKRKRQRFHKYTKRYNNNNKITLNTL